MIPFRVGCRRFLEGSHGDRAFVGNDEPDHHALHHYAGLNPRTRARASTLLVRIPRRVFNKPGAKAMGVAWHSIAGSLRESSREKPSAQV
jgi:hypothetical protein